MKEQLINLVIDIFVFLLTHPYISLVVFALLEYGAIYIFCYINDKKRKDDENVS